MKVKEQYHTEVNNFYLLRFYFTMYGRINWFAATNFKRSNEIYYVPVTLLLAYSNE